MITFAILFILNCRRRAAFWARINDDNGWECGLDIRWLGRAGLGGGLWFLACIFMASCRTFLDVDAGLVFYEAFLCTCTHCYKSVDLFCSKWMNLSLAYYIYLYYLYNYKFLLFKLIAFDVQLIYISMVYKFVNLMNKNKFKVQCLLNL